MYSILGGDVSRMQEKSDLGQLQVKTEETLQRGRGRPKKYGVTHISINSTQKKLRRFDEKDNNVISGALLGKKGKRKSQSYNIWYLSCKVGRKTTVEMTHRRRWICFVERRSEGWAVRVLTE
jgi:hypothetical protein